MKRLARIPSQLLSKDLTESLHLNEQSYLILVPSSLLHNLNLDSITFDLMLDKGRISLVGPEVVADPRVSQSVVEESVT